MHESSGGDSLSYDNRISAPGSIPLLSEVPFCSPEIEQDSRVAEKTAPAGKAALAAEAANKGIKIDVNLWFLKHFSGTSCIGGKLSADAAVGGRLQRVRLVTYLVDVDLLLVLFPLLQEVLVLLLDDQLGQRVLRQRGRLGPVQGPVFG